MFETLLKLVPLVGSAFQWLTKVNKDKRDSFANHCEDISKLLKTYADATDDQRLSTNLCAELNVYVPKIEEIAKGILDSNQLTDMAMELGSVCKRWREHTEKIGKDSHIDAESLKEIDAAAGHFNGLAKLVRTM